MRHFTEKHKCGSQHEVIVKYITVEENEKMDSAAVIGERSWDHQSHENFKFVS